MVAAAVILPHNYELPGLTDSKKLTEKQREKYSVVEAYKTEELKELGFSDKEINSYRKISLYDEILINPSSEKLKELK